MKDASKNENQTTAVRNDKIGLVTHFSHKQPFMRHWDVETHLPQIAALGVGWIRDEILQREVEYAPGKYRLPEISRRWIEAANSLGLKIIVCLGGPNPHYEDPYDPQAYAALAAWLAKELDGKVAALEIINEPFAYWAENYDQGHRRGGTWYARERDGSRSEWMERYVKLLNTAADAVKAANPNMKVIGIGCTPPQNHHMLAMGISPNVDGMTDHPYNFRTTPEIVPHADTPRYRQLVGFPVADKEGTFSSLIQGYREKSRQHKGPGEIWITEFGWTTFREGGEGAPPLYAGVTEQAQAKYLLRRFMYGLALDLTVDIAYASMDKTQPGGEFEAENGFGLVRADGTPKPAYHAVGHLARATAGFRPGNAQPIEVTAFSDRSETHPRVWEGGPLPALQRIMAFPFTDANGDPVFALWSAERPSDLNVRSATITFPSLSHDVRIVRTDLMTGKVDEVVAETSADGAILRRFPVPDYPVLLSLQPAEQKPGLPSTP